MTVVALLRGREGTYNALFVDTGAVRSDGLVARLDKLHQPFGETFVTCVGYASLLDLLANQVASRPKRPNLRDPRFVSELYAELDLARARGVLLGRPTAFPPPPPATTLVVCSRADVFFWKAEFDTGAGASRVPSAATYLPPDAMTVIRGYTVASLKGFATFPMEQAEELIVDQMLHVNRMVEENAGGDPLGYEIGRSVSGILLPHRTSDPRRRIEPGLPAAR
jgi:hypothetical protein